MCSDGGGCDPGEDEGAGSVGKDCVESAITCSREFGRCRAYVALQSAASILDPTSCL